MTAGTGYFVVCPCGARRARTSTRTLDDAVRLYAFDGSFVLVPSGTPVCKRPCHDFRILVACCGEWAASHLTLPCGNVRQHDWAIDENGKCRQCRHTAACCRGDA